MGLIDKSCTNFFQVSQHGEFRAIIGCDRFEYLIPVFIVLLARKASNFVGTYLVFKTGLDDNIDARM